MYGTLVKVEEDIPEQPKTPASTSLFVRTVRNFGGPRFRRSVHEGYIEDLLIEEETEEIEVSKDFRNTHAYLISIDYLLIFLKIKEQH